MELIFNEIPKLKITVKRGEEAVSYEVVKPTMAHQKALQDELEKCQADNKSPFNVMIQWAVNLGLPEEFVLSLQPETFIKFIEELSGNKKK